MWLIHLSFLHATWRFNSLTARSLMPIVAKFLLQSFLPVVNDPWIGKLQKASIPSLTSWILNWFWVLMIFYFWIFLTSLTLYIWIMPLVVNELNSNGFFYYILESILQRLLSLELSVYRILRSCSHGIRPEVILRLLGSFLKPCFLSSY
jgi:hypothetical protein